MPIEWFTAARYGFTAAKAGYDYRHAVQRYWTKAKAFADRGETQIVITGSPGAGKTVLIGQMHGKARTLYYENPDASLGVETDAIQFGQWGKLVRTLPGQTNLRTAGEIDVYTNNTSLEGVIHVVDWGYSAPRTPAVLASLVNKDGIRTIDQLREYNLRIELDSLKFELANIRRLFYSKRRPKWLVIAVNKVDLFYNDADRSLVYYHKDGEGLFASALKSLETDLGASHLRIETIQVCASEENFEYNGHKVASCLERGQKDKILRDFVNSVAIIAESNQ
ncbi:hypothetical protein ACFFGH_16980 [Lysobacter korlensis]|uniref:G domain-containing protein n=1 Tax=Lysobacter korlensis TaxID=553636 RepID=A0ABV6RRC7_9GAMM